LKIKDRLYQITRFLSDNGRLIYHVLKIRTQWRVCPSRTCHFLVIQNPIYGQLFLYAVASLLFHNPDFEVKLHCDSKCYKRIYMKSQILFGSKVSFVMTDLRNSNPMFEKAKLLISLQGSSDFFIDADTRINGPLPILSQVSVLVKEFSLAEHSIWKDICNFMEIEPSELSMLNTTFYTWGGKSQGIKLQEFSSFYMGFLNLNWKALSINNNFDPTKYTRLVEQFFFSYILSNEKVNALKSIDKVADKGVIESSYFGASGYRFGR
jgi:hypothetical protein